MAFPALVKFRFRGSEKKSVVKLDTLTTTATSVK